MELRRTSRRAERVDGLLRGALATETVEDRQIVAIAATLRGWPGPTLRPDFRATLRARLVAGPAVRSDAVTARRRAAMLARPALVGALASSVAAVGLSVGARDALPGEPLYGVKRQVEQIQITLAGSETARARAHLDVARTRLGEAHSLLGTGDTGAADEIPGLLDAWEREARSGSTVLVGQAQAGDAQALATMAEFTADQSEDLSVLVEQLPEGDAHVTAEQALDYIENVGATLDTFVVAGSPESESPDGQPGSSPSATESPAPTASSTESAGPGASPSASSGSAATSGPAATARTGGATTPGVSSTGLAATPSDTARQPSTPAPTVPPLAPPAPGVPVPAVPSVPATPLPPLPSAVTGGGFYIDDQLAVQGLEPTDKPAAAPS